MSVPHPRATVPESDRVLVLSRSHCVSRSLAGGDGTSPLSIANWRPQLVYGFKASWRAINNRTAETEAGVMGESRAPLAGSCRKTGLMTIL
jgi:hypothetical protein